MKANSQKNRLSPRRFTAGRYSRYLITALLAAGASFLQADDPPAQDPPAKEKPADAKPDEKEKPADAKAAEKTEEKADEKADDKDKAKDKDAKEEKSDDKDAKEKDAKALTPAQDFEGGSKAYNNWLEISAGRFYISGNKAQSEQRHRLSDGAFGGIEDLHYSQAIKKDTTLTIDGHGLWDEHDYKLSLDLRQEKFGFFRISYEQYRSYSDGDGGFFAPGSIWFPRSDNALALDRGEFSFEAGLALEKLPKVTYKYTHRFRDGQKDSTIWGPSHPDLTTTVRAIVPGFTDINERSDSFELNATHHIKATEFGAGVRYEVGSMTDARKSTLWPDELSERKLTTKEETTYDSFRVNTFTETWLNKKAMLSTGFLFAKADSDMSGSRIYGSDFDVSYNPNLLNYLGYTELTGESDRREYLMNLNLMLLPRKDLTVVPSIKVRKETWEADSLGRRTLGVNAPTWQSSTSDGHLLDVTERFDVQYTGFTNKVVYARAEWTQGDGRLNEFGGIEENSPIQQRTEDRRNFQKYTVGTRLYPHRIVTIDVGGYFKINRYEYDHLADSTSNLAGSGNRYPAFLAMQDFETWDANARLTLRPWTSVTLVTRYDYQISTIHTRPESVSGLGDVESSQLSTHIISQNITWSPWSRLYLQGGADFVHSQDRSPISDYTQAVLKAQNSYLTVNGNVGFVVDNKTDLNVGYFYYLADNPNGDGSLVIPYAAAAEEHGVTARLTRRLTESLRLGLRYGYFHFEDNAMGGILNTQAHVVSSSLQYRF